MKVSFTTLRNYLVVLAGVLTLVNSQCRPGDRVQFFEDGNSLVQSSPTLNRAVGDSFVLGCKRCGSNNNPPRWHYANGTEVPSCDMPNAPFCAEINASDGSVRDLRFTSFATSQAGTYACTIQPITININTNADEQVASIGFSQLRYFTDEDEDSVEIMLMLNTSLSKIITVSVTSIDDSATVEGNDYTPGPYSVRIPTGVTNRSFMISITDDSVYESNESFQLTIDTSSLPDGVIPGDPARAEVIIRNDDTASIGFEKADYVVNEGDGLVQPVIILSNAMPTDIMVQIRDKEETANGDDYVFEEMYEVTLRSGMTSVLINIPIIDDNIMEDDETFSLIINDNILSDDITFSANKRTRVTIRNDDNVVVVGFNQTTYNISESDALVRPILTLSSPLSTDLTLQVLNIDSSATVNDDYSAGPYNVVFPAGETTSSFNVVINDDDILESTENFSLRIDSSSVQPNTVTVGMNDEVTVYILNDDSSVIKFTQEMYNVNEGDEVVQPELVLSHPSSSVITVQVNDNGTTATEGDDYNSGPYMVKFPVGQTRGSFNVSITKDNITEGIEKFYLTIDSSTLPAGVTIDATGVARVTIAIDDRAQTEAASSSDSSNSATGVVVAVVVALLVIIAVIVATLILILLYHKKRSKHIRLYKVEHTDNGIGLNGKVVKTTDSNEDDNESIMATVIFKVSSKDPLVKKVTTSLGQPTTLFVELPYSDQSEITWKKDGSPVDHLVLSDGSLYITDTSLSDKGEYTVTATGTDDATSETVQLAVIDPKLPTNLSKHLPVKVEDFPEHVALMQSDDSIRFEREYEKIAVDGPFSQHAAKHYANASKNRYKNIIPHDHSRVVLTQLDQKSGRDYINASFVDGYKESRAYIAAQGPLGNTVEDFWRMIWEHNVTTIVMVTKLVENLKVKCHQYWPSEHKNYGKFKVTNKKEETIAKYTIRTFTVEKVSDEKTEIREVRHFHYLAWPDHGVPKYGTDLLEFQKRIDKFHKRKNGTPMLVHCSAGVGRSGTFIAIDIEMQRIKHENVVDVYNCVCGLRFCRDLMVQSEEQYALIHTALLEHITCGDTSITAPTENVQDTVNKLSALDPSTKKTGFELQFEKLTKASPKPIEFTYSDATSSLNRKKNRSKKFIPPDTARARLSQTDDESDYVNASQIDGYRHCKAFLVGPGPMKSTVNDFWRMIWEKQSFAIVMLGQLVENGEESSFKYWPDKGDKMELRNFVIETIVDDPMDNNVMKRSIKITHKQTDTDKIVTQLQYVEWSPKYCPNNPTSIVDLLEVLERVQRKTSNGPITVHCSDGTGRSGTFCALMISINRFKAEQMTDVFQTINTMRTQKPGVVENHEQYKFIHEALIAMLQRFSNYSNFTLESSL